MCRVQHGAAGMPVNAGVHLVERSPTESKVLEQQCALIVASLAVCARVRLRSCLDPTQHP